MLAVLAEIDALVAHIAGLLETTKHVARLRCDPNRIGKASSRVYI
jgi:hypothetical protein